MTNDKKALEYLVTLSTSSCTDCPICYLNNCGFEWLDCWKKKTMGKKDCIKLLVGFCRARAKKFITVNQYIVKLKNNKRKNK